MDAALQDYSEAIRLRPNDAEAFNNRGVVRRDQGDKEGALQDFNEAIHLSPNRPEAFNNRGVLRRDQGDMKGALQDFDEAIRLKPNAANAFDNRAKARQALGDAAGASKDRDNAIRLGYRPPQSGNWTRQPLVNGTAQPSEPLRRSQVRMFWLDHAFIPAKVGNAE
jgi:tetratricopeptide (TPR) repeat protein